MHRRPRRPHGCRGRRGKPRHPARHSYSAETPPSTAPPRGGPAPKCGHRRPASDVHQARGAHGVGHMGRPETIDAGPRKAPPDQRARRRSASTGQGQPDSHLPHKPYHPWPHRRLPACPHPRGAGKRNTRERSGSNRRSSSEGTDGDTNQKCSPSRGCGPQSVPDTPTRPRDDPASPESTGPSQKQ